MPDITSLVEAATAAKGLGNLLLVIPGQDAGIRADVPGSKSFLFHYEGENTATLDSDITDHFVEDNTALQDQIALKPILVNTEGFIGELNDIPPPFLAAIKTAIDRLTPIGPYTPQISVSAQIAYNRAAQAYAAAAAVANVGVSAWDTIAGNGSQNLQQKAYSMFEGYWKQRALFTVQTPWAIFKNMAIKTLRAVQDQDTRMVTSFAITFKKMNFATTTTTVAFEGRADAMMSVPVDHGVSTPVPSNSLSTGLSQMGVA